MKKTCLEYLFSIYACYFPSPEKQIISAGNLNSNILQNIFTDLSILYDLHQT
jgi:hypothetical protein